MENRLRYSCLSTGTSMMRRRPEQSHKTKDLSFPLLSICSMLYSGRLLYLQARPKDITYAAQTSCPAPSIQLPSWLTLEFQSNNLWRMLPICFISSTLGCTQVM